MRRALNAMAPVAAAAAAAGRCPKPKLTKSEEERRITEEELRQHSSASDAWVAFHGAVYDVTPFVRSGGHPACPGLAWAERVAGRRFEHFLGRDAFGPAHQNCGPDAGCCSRDVRAGLEKLLQPYRIGALQPPPPSAAGRRWPDVAPEMLELRVEHARGRLAAALSVAELRAKYARAERVVTHKCSSTGSTKTQQWAGVRVRDLLPLAEVGGQVTSSSWDPLVTFVGMDGFGYSMFRSRAIQDDVILAYERGGIPLDTEDGGPLRLIKDGQHAKWVEKVIVE